ncbi:MAG: type II secretion system minor pseudopilin GspK [Porticoccaceae bacterium]|nr:type II secretion system minor pseudopilin GspK [Porticoccaceae bacterium]
MSDSLSSSQRQRGVALIAVLLLLVFILTIVGGLFYRHQIHIQKVTRSLVGEQALLLLLSAESWGQSVLVEDGKRSAIDHNGENWARALPLLPVEGGAISGCLRDLQGLFNINSLSWYGNKSWEDELAAELGSAGKSTRRTLFRRLLEQLQLDAGDARIAALVDWLDEDSWLLSPDSAEDNEYLLLTPAYRAANQSMVELAELSLVQGFSAADVVALQPYVNILPEDTAININTAPAMVLMALSPLITRDIAEALIASRPYDSVDGFYSQLAILAGETRQTLASQLPAEFVAVGSEYFSLSADVRLAGVRMAYRSIIHRQGQGARVISRTLRYIPAGLDENSEALAVHSVCNPLQEVDNTP